MLEPLGGSAGMICDRIEVEPYGTHVRNLLGLYTDRLIGYGEGH